MKSFKSKQNIYFVMSFIFGLILSGVLYFLNHDIILSSIILFCDFIWIVLYFISFKKWSRYNAGALKSLSALLDEDNRETLENFSIPLLLCSENFEPIWFNNKFSSDIILNRESVADFSKYIPDIDSDSSFFEIDGKIFYTMFSVVKIKHEKCYVIFYTDVTEIMVDAQKFKSIKPVVMLGFYDNLDEMVQDYSDSDYNEIKTGIDRILENWLSSYNCIFRRIGSERFIVIAHEKDFSSMKDNKFDILKKIKEYKFNGNPSGVTLSIGIGRSDNLKDSEKMARQSLDMALSRGGDQVAVKDIDGYEFFGGYAMINDKTDKVRSRVVASAVNQVIASCEDVYIMGHKFSDMDSIGASIGLYSVLKQVGKRVFIVCDTEKSLALNLVEKFTNDCSDNPFIEPLTASLKIQKKSALIIVDNHRKVTVEMPDLLDKTNNIIVIDHHRKAVDFIDNSIVFHHDPNASSTSEMVTELLPYMYGDVKLTKIEADALLAGITLDTKNFILRTGVRTFEAAAFLRGFGADSLRVKEFFTSTAEDYRLKNDIVSKAVIYSQSAIAFAEVESKDLRIISSQAADELLNISDVKCSFVLYKTDGGINISARSLGNVNVQLIMEAMGGGGHLTMAATQLKDVTPEEAIRRLRTEIDKYFNENN